MRCPLLLVFVLSLPPVAAGSGAAGDQKETGKPAPASRQAVGRLFSPMGTLLQRQKVASPWQLPELYATLYAGDELVALPGARAEVQLREGDVRLSLRGNLPELSPAPMLESAVVLLPPGQQDFALILERGRVVLENHKEKGNVFGRFVQGSQTVLELGLEKGSRVAVERASHWPAGTPFYKEPKKGHAPLTSFVLLVVKGNVELTFNSEKHHLQGPALFQFQLTPQLEGRGPFPLKKLPDWLLPADEPGAKTRAVHTAVEHVRRRLADKLGVGNLAELLKEDDPLRGRLAVLSANAIDDVALVLASLEDPRHPGVRATAVTALRHWIGRGQGQDLALYGSLQKKLTAGQAEIAMTLLRGFGEQDRARADTYDVLIRYLQHDQLAVRELARWNLYTLVPQGKEIAYDAAAPAEERSRAQAAWRKLIPEGQVPRQP